MNSKGIKAMRWHKKSLITAIREAGIDADFIEMSIDNIIDNLDFERIKNSEINVAHKEGYDMGYIAGKALSREPREWYAGWED